MAVPPKLFHYYYTCPTRRDGDANRCVVTSFFEHRCDERWSEEVWKKGRRATKLWPPGAVEWCRRRCRLCAGGQTDNMELNWMEFWIGSVSAHICCRRRNRQRDSQCLDWEMNRTWLPPHCNGLLSAISTQFLIVCSKQTGKYQRT